MSTTETVGHVDEIWRGPTGLHWCADSFGGADRALYAGGINVGSVQRVPHLHHGKQSTPWRAWIMTDEDGKEIGWFSTEQEAKDALADIAAKELCK